MTSFFFSDGWSEKKYWSRVADLVEWWPDIALEARRVPPDTGYLIPVKGKSMKQIFPD